MLLYNNQCIKAHVIYWKRIGNVLGDFGANWVHFRSKPGTKLLINYKYDGAIRVFCTYTYFTVLNVPNSCMTHPWYIPCQKFTLHSIFVSSSPV